jgi:hypothetical protein
VQSLGKWQQQAEVELHATVRMVMGLWPHAASFGLQPPGNSQQLAGVELQAIARTVMGLHLHACVGSQVGRLCVRLRARLGRVLVAQ